MLVLVSPHELSAIKQVMNVRSCLHLELHDKTVIRISLPFHKLDRSIKEDSERLNW